MIVFLITQITGFGYHRQFPHSQALKFLNSKFSSEEYGSECRRKWQCNVPIPDPSRAISSGRNGSQQALAHRSQLRPRGALAQRCLSARNDILSRWTVLYYCGLDVLKYFDLIYYTCLSFLFIIKYRHPTCRIYYAILWDISNAVK